MIARRGAVARSSHRHRLATGSRHCAPRRVVACRANDAAIAEVKASFRGLEAAPLSGAVTLLTLAPSLPAMADEAVDAAATVQEGGFDASYLLVLAPIVLYGIFNLYRAQVNPKATLNDFLFITAALVIFGNIISIIVFKVRWF